MIRRGMLIFLALSLWAISGVFGQTQKPLINADILNMTKQGFDLKFVAELSSKTAIDGDPVKFLLDDDLRVGESIVISNGAHAVATVSSAKKAGMMGKPGELSVQMQYLVAGSNHVRSEAQRAARVTARREQRWR
jgi:hypothetical protein